MLTAAERADTYDRVIPYPDTDDESTVISFGLARNFANAAYLVAIETGGNPIPTRMRLLRERVMSGLDMHAQYLMEPYLLDERTMTLAATATDALVEVHRSKDGQ